MKKIFAAILLLITVCSVVSCGPAQEFSRGSIYDNRYVSGFADVAVIIPDGWRFYDDEELAGVNGFDVEMLKDIKKFKESDRDSIVDMMAQDTATGNSINIAIAGFHSDEIESSDREFANLMREEIVEAYKDEENTTVTCSVPDGTIIWGYNYRKFTVDIDLDGFKVRQAHYIRIANGKAITISITIADDTEFSRIESLISKAYQ